jgi:beta-galactosidase
MRNQIRWKDIEYKDGYCEAVAKTDGKIVARHRIETTGKPVALKIDSDNSTWKADGTDLQHLRIYAVDSKGRRVQTATGDVKVTIDGTAATLAAMSNGNQASDELNVVDHRMLYNGSVLAILRSDVKSGTITVTATCEGLKSAKAKFTTK